MDWAGKVLLLTLGVTLLVLVLTLFRQPLKGALRLAGRTGVGLGALALLQWVGGAIGLGLGVSLTNALVIGVLGVPGLGLLMMLNWMTMG